MKQGNASAKKGQVIEEIVQKAKQSAVMRGTKSDEKKKYNDQDQWWRLMTKHVFFWYLQLNIQI